MALLIIQDKITILSGGQGPCEILRIYSVRGDAGEEIVFYDSFSPTAKHIQIKRQVANLICPLKEGSFKVPVRINDFKGGEEEVLTISPEIYLKEATPYLCLFHGITINTTDMHVNYSCSISLPFEIDKSWEYEVSVPLGSKKFVLDDSRRHLELQPIDIFEINQDDFFFTVKILLARPLPLLRSLGIQYKNIFQNVHLILVPHLLDDFPHFAEALLSAGAKEDDIYIVGIPYSTQERVVQKLKGKGLPHVYSPRMYPFHDYIDRSLDWLKEKYNKAIEKRNPFEWMIIEDGGYVVPALHKKILIDACWEDLGKCCLGAVEQTRNGVWAFQDEVAWYERKIPLCSVAEARLKLEIESRWIGEAVYTNIINLLSQCNILQKDGDKALILGLGTTGRQIAKKFKENRWEVMGYDNSAVATAIARTDGISTYDLSSLPKDQVKGVHLVIGATGRDNVINKDYIEAMENGTIIVNASSKRKEIDWRAIGVAERPQQIASAHIYDIPNRYGNDKRIYILAEGYPVNFYTGNSVKPANIELIMGCLFRAAVEIVEDKPRQTAQKLFHLDIKDKKFYEELKQKAPSDDEKRHGIFVFPGKLEEEIAGYWLKN